MQVLHLVWWSSVPLERDDFIKDLIDVSTMKWLRSTAHGMFRVRGTLLMCSRRMQKIRAYWVLSGDEVESISEVSNVTGEVLREFGAIQFGQHLTTLLSVKDYPCSSTISEEMEARVKSKENDKLPEAQRLAQRTNYDLVLRDHWVIAMVMRTHIFRWSVLQVSLPIRSLIISPKDMICIIDESHVTAPQIRGMYEGLIGLMDYAGESLI